MIKGSTLQDTNIYVPNNRAQEYIKQKLLRFEGEIDESTIIVGNQ